MLAASAVAFLVIGAWLSEHVGVWSEEISTYPTGPNRGAVAESEALVLESCAEGFGLRASEARPVLSLCAFGRTWPVLVAPYISGWIYWPLGALVPNDAFTLRKIGLALGLLTLLLCFRVTSRVADPWTAAAGALATAFASPFALAHSLLVHYELTPLPLVLLSVLLLVDAHQAGPIGRGRAVAIGLVAGLAVAANVKALFLFGALGAFAWRTERLPRLSPETQKIMGLAAAVPLAPMLLYALFDTHGGFSGQMEHRLLIFFSRLVSPSLLLEPLNLLTYWTDVAAYGDVAAREASVTYVLPLVLPALALGRVTLHLVLALRRRPHDALAAALGALILGYLLVGALLYTQQPAANYAPLQAVFGFATGSTAVALARWAAKRFALSPQLGAALGALLASLAVAGLGWHTLRRDPSELALATNAASQRAAVAYLEAHPGPPVVTASYNLAGVVDSISGGRVPTVQIGPFVWRCGRDDDPGRDACLEARWRAAIEALGPSRLLIPAQRAVSDEGEVELIRPVLERLASQGAVVLEDEASFRGAGTPPLLSLLRVAPSRAP